MKKDIRESLEQKLYECDKHVEKLDDAKEYLKEIMPLTLEKYLQVDKIQSSFIDQLNFRFSKLQDSIGESITQRYFNTFKRRCEKDDFFRHFK